jgi:2-oxoglutarate ferredoxin oxidoreductase subunit beta
MDHDGFSFIECLSECVEFYPGAFDASNPRKGGAFNLVPEDHNVADELAAYKLASEPIPGYFGIFYRQNRPTKNRLETKVIEDARQKIPGMADWQILKQSFDRMK